MSKPILSDAICPITVRLHAELAEAEKKAWDSLARYKFMMFGYWAAMWVHLNRVGNFRRPNPFRACVKLAGAIQTDDTAETSNGEGMAGLFKTTIVIWTPYDPSGCAVSELAQDTEPGGKAMCVSEDSQFVEEPGSDEHPPEMAFFFPATAASATDQLSER